jgi:hypothetical protein
MRPRIRTCLVAGLLTLAAVPLAALPGIAVAQGTPDGVTPAVETVCAKTRGGAAYGLCVAYCEANDCDLEPGSRECTRLRENYAKITGGSTLPCDGEPEELK